MKKTTTLLKYAFLLAFLSLATTLSYAQCGAGQSSLDIAIDLTSDGFPDENGWIIVNTNTGAGVDSACFGVYSLVTGIENISLCLDTGITYSLYAMDDFGDGLDGAEYRLAFTYGSGIDTIGVNNFNIARTLCTPAYTNNEIADSTSFYVPYIAPPACLAADSLTASAITTTTADLNWRENNSAIQWEIQYDSIGFILGTGIDSIVNAKPKTITGLSSDTEYGFYVRSICGVGDTSSWSVVGTFKTAFACPVGAICATYTTGLIQSDMGFTALPGTSTCPGSLSITIPAGNRIDSLTTRYDMTAFAAPNNAWMSEQRSWLYSVNAALGEATLSNGAGNSAGTFSYQRAGITVANGVTGVADFELHVGRTFGGTACAIDYSEIDSASWIVIAYYSLAPACLEPVNSFTTDLTSDSVQLNWAGTGTATEWIIEYDTTGFTAGTGSNTQVILTDTFTVITGLTELTSYDFYVRSICGPSDTSSFTTVESFTTPCDPLVAPFSESFDNTSLPSCWASSSISGGPWIFGTPGFTWNTTGCAASTPIDHTGNAGNYAAMDHSGGDVGVILELPDVDISALTTPYIDFYFTMCGTGYTPLNLLHIEAYNGSTWDSVSVIQQGTIGWEQFGFDLTGFTYNIDLVRVRFRAESGGSGSDFYGDNAIDDVSIDEAPSCPSPSTLLASNITSSSADLDWTENGTATSWQIEYDSVGFTQGSGNDSLITSKPFAWTGLSPNSSYSFYVRAICGAGDSSAWTGPLTFTTDCQTYTSPYTEAFDTFTPDCWDQAGDGTPLTGFTGIGASDWRAEEYLNTLANGGGAAINLFGNSDEEWILSPNFDLSVGGPLELLVDAGVTDWLSAAADNMGSDDTVQVLVSTDAGITWTVLQTWDVNNQPPTLGQTYTIDLSSYTGTNNTFAIWATDGAVNDIEDYDFHIGNFAIQEMPAPYYPIGTINTVDSLGVGDSIGLVMQTSGTVVGVDLDGNNGLSFYIIDMSSSSQEGINIFNFNDVSNYVVTEGDSIRVWGDVDQFNGQQQVFVDSIEIISTGAFVPAARGVNNLDESTEANHISLTDAFVLIDASGSFSYNMDATNGIDTITIRVDADTDVNDSLNVAGQGLLVGDTICGLSGVGGQFDSSSPHDDGYQVFPMRFSDLTICRLVAVCSEPTALSSSNLSVDSATLSWTENGTAIEWEISYGSTGFTAGSGNQAIASANPFDLLSLNSNTAYDWYVRAICGPGDTSIWSDTSSFTTLAIILPYYPIGTINTVDSIGVGDSIGLMMQTSGTVVGVDLDGNNGLNFYIIDMSSSSQEGINIFNFNDVSNYVVTEGDSIRVWGDVNQFNGQQQVFVDSIEIISTGAFVPAARGVNNLDESTEANHISLIDDFVLLDPSGAFSYNMDATNGIDTITIRVDADTDVNDSLNTAGQSLFAGDTICGLSGVGGQFDNSSPFDGGYQIFPMRFSDLTICRLAVGLNDVTPVQSTFSIVPNPSSGEFNIRTSGFNNPSVRVQIRDMSGRIVKDEILSNANVQVNKSIDLVGNAKGIYFISIFDGNQIINQKLILR